ncbi:hypothetical protein TWF281_004452 [Arthrobotrys megalospora]
MSSPKFAKAKAPSVSTAPNSTKKTPNDDIGLVKLINDPEFSDVTVLVGKTEKEYKLHRNIISHGSDFFKVCCREGKFMEGNQRLIRLPEIDTGAFDIVIRWIYNGGYFLPDRVKKTPFCKIHQAADFLGVRTLKKEMLEQVAVRLFGEIEAEVQDETVENPISLFQGIAANSSISEWVELRRVADNIFPTWYLADKDLFELAQGSGSRCLESAVILDLYQELLERNFCTDCQNKVQHLNPLSCQRCKKSIIPRAIRADSGAPTGKNKASSDENTIELSSQSSAT